MAARRVMRTGFRRSKPAHYLWIRDARNSVTPIVSPATQSVDLFDTYRLATGIDLNLPEFTIWRIRIKISIRFTPQSGTATHLESNSGCTVALFVDNMKSATSLPGPLTSPYDQKWLLWDNLYTSKTISQSVGFSNVASSEDVMLYGEYDLKGRRRLLNLGDTLVFQIEPNADGTVVNYSLTYQVLTRLRD